MRPIFPYLKPHVPKMTLGLVIKFFGTTMDLMIPWMLSYILDYVVPERSVKKILIWGGLMVLSAALALVTNVIANRMASAVARETTRSLRHDLFQKISYLSSRQIDYFSIPSL